MPSEDTDGKDAREADIFILPDPSSPSTSVREDSISGNSILPVSRLRELLRLYVIVTDCASAGKQWAKLEEM